MKYEHLVAGISGGVASTLILHPLDLIKIRFAGNVINFIGSFAVTHIERNASSDISVIAWSLVLIAL
jgi:NH3-dependent NAD+ synthetase